MNAHRTRILTATVTLLVALAVSTTLTSGTAGAMSPPQSTESGVVNLLYPNLDSYWRWQFARWGRSYQYRSPVVSYYTADQYAAGWGCNATIKLGQLGVACGPNQIWIAYWQNQNKIDWHGDFAGGFILAHEFGHLVQMQLGYGQASIAARELFADCMAGSFSRWAWSWGRLDNGDFWEAVNTIYGLGAPAPGFGYPALSTRVDWFNWGFQSNNPDQCFRALSIR